MFYVTAFTPIFVILAVMACRGIPQWMTATMIAAFFQSASPILTTAGGRLSGIATAYALLPIGMLHFLTYKLRNPRSAQPIGAYPSAPAVWLSMLTLIGVVGAMLLPRVFEGAVRVLPPGYGLDVGFAEPLRPSGRNIIQAFYLVCNLSLFLLCSYFLRKSEIDLKHCLKGLSIGAIIAALIGIYQVVGFELGLPWPSGVINSNLGFAQLYQQTAFGIKRMSATFVEPSILSLHFIAMFALFGLGMRRWLLGSLMALCLILSLSSTAYMALLAIVAVWIVSDLPRLGLSAAPIFFLILGLLGGAYVADLVWLNGAITEGFLFNKLSSSSGLVRLRAESLGLASAFESYGLGTGLGSARASSFFVTLAATMGVPGLICFLGFMASLINACFSDGATEAKALGLALIATAIAWALSVPDLSLPLPWLIAGIAYGSVRSPAAYASDRVQRVFDGKAAHRKWVDRDVVFR